MVLKYEIKPLGGRSHWAAKAHFAKMRIGMLRRRYRLWNRLVQADSHGPVFSLSGMRLGGGP